MTPEPTYAANVIAHVARDFLDTLTPAEVMALSHMHEVWLRPDQVIPWRGWRSFGALTGRGFGKTYAIGCHVNQRVQAGDVRSVALMAPTIERVHQVQFDMLIATAPPWFMPERYREMLRWPNGVTAIAYSANDPDTPRGDSVDLSWGTELVDWNPRTAIASWNELSTIARASKHAQVMYDTTSKGKNPLILMLEAKSKRDPRTHRLLRGTIFDNPVYSAEYLRDTCSQYEGRRYDEEMLGLAFAEAGGALWEQAWLDKHRVSECPRFDLTIVCVDPAKSARADADETGIMVMSRAADSGHAYAVRDHTGRYKPEQWAEIVVDECAAGAAGAVIEATGSGDFPTAVLRGAASTRGIEVRTLARGEPFPVRTPGVIYVREHHARESKIERAGGPAVESKAGRVHMVGVLPELEYELTTYEHGVRGWQSPNRYDAFVWGVIELRGLTVDGNTGANDTALAAQMNARIVAHRQANVRARDIARPVVRGRGRGGRVIS